MFIQLICLLCCCCWGSKIGSWTLCKFSCRASLLQDVCALPYSRVPFFVMDRQTGLLSMWLWERIIARIVVGVLPTVTLPLGLLRPIKSTIPTLAWKRWPWLFILAVRSTCPGGDLDVRHSTNFKWSPKRFAAPLDLTYLRSMFMRSSPWPCLHSMCGTFL